MKIVVVGAGVTGLTTAYLLSEKGYDVNIISRKFYFDGYDDPTYTSNFAGANWASFAKNDEIRLQNFDKPGYFKFVSLARNEPKSGVYLQYNVVKVTRESFELNRRYEDDSQEVAAYLPWYKDMVEEFKMISANELESEFAFGYSYLGIVISTTTYLAYLMGKCIDNGVQYKRCTLNHIMDAQLSQLSTSPTDDVIIINCTGISSNSLEGVRDQNIFPIRGQTVVVENDFPNKLSVKFHEPQFVGESFYLMPRLEGGCVIGGCMLPDNWSGEPDMAMLDRFLARALKYCPQLVDPSYKGNPSTLKVVRHQVGLRPGRKGDVKVERDEEFKNLIHNYGAGGTGYQSSYGTCSEVVKIVDSIFHHQLKL